MLAIKRQIPNLITCSNLLCGCIGIDLAYHGDIGTAPFLMLLAAVFDFFDGFVARLLKVSSPIGKELDSLADLISFGLLPGVILGQLLLPFAIDGWENIYYVAWIIPVFSALRLAKFNVDTRQAESFIGLPTPANALIWGSFPLIMISQPHIGEWINNPWFLIGLAIVLSGLLVAELPLFALKFKSQGWKGNELRYTFLIGCLALILSLSYAGLALSVVFYILLSVVSNWKGGKGNATTPDSTPSGRQ